MLKGGAASRLVKFTTTLLPLARWVGCCNGYCYGFLCSFLWVNTAAITAVGTIMMPKMIEQGYPTPFVRSRSICCSIRGIDTSFQCCNTI